jgi:hypothetical protein
MFLQGFGSIETFKDTMPRLAGEHQKMRNAAVFVSLSSLAARSVHLGLCGRRDREPRTFCVA